MKECEIIVLADGAPVTAGVFILENGSVTVRPREGYEAMLDEMLHDGNIIDGGARRVMVEENPEAWFAALPANYHGAYLRASLRG